MRKLAKPMLDYIILRLAEIGRLERPLNEGRGFPVGDILISRSCQNLEVMSMYRRVGEYASQDHFGGFSHPDGCLDKFVQPMDP